MRLVRPDLDYPRRSVRDFAIILCGVWAPAMLGLAIWPPVGLLLTIVLAFIGLLGPLIRVAEISWRVPSRSINLPQYLHQLALAATGCVWLACFVGGIHAGFDGPVGLPSPRQLLALIMSSALILVLAVPYTMLLWLFSRMCDGLFVRLRRFLEPTECARCGYDLTGNVSGVCPECGATVTPAKVTDETRS